MSIPGASKSCIAILDTGVRFVGMRMFIISMHKAKYEWWNNWTGYRNRAICSFHMRAFLVYLYTNTYVAAIARCNVDYSYGCCNSLVFDRHCLRRWIHHSFCGILPQPFFASVHNIWFSHQSVLNYFATTFNGLVWTIEKTIQFRESSSRQMELIKPKKNANNVDDTLIVVSTPRLLRMAAKQIRR